MAASDRLTGPLRVIARAADPLAAYRAMYRARVLAQSADHRLVDVMPEDAGGMVPPMSNIPLRHGVPGLKVRLRFHDEFGDALRIYVLVGWENGKPNRPYAALWEDLPAAAVDRISVPVQSLGRVEIGDTGLSIVQDGVLTGKSVDPFTGLLHYQIGNASLSVLAKK